MENIGDKYCYVQDAIELYKTMIKIWGLHTPQSKFIKPFFIGINRPIIQRILISHYSAQIARANEIILDLEDSLQKEEYEQAISDYIENVETFNMIRPKQPMSHKELKQHIKNALAHAEYDIDISVDKDPKIIFHSNYIEGEIPTEDLEKLAVYYIDLATMLDLSKESYYGMNDLFTIEKNNNELLKRSISQITVGENFVDMKLPKNIKIYTSQACFNGTAKPISEKQQELIYNYIKYATGQKWFQLSFSERASIFNRAIVPILSEEYTFQHSTHYLTTTLQWILKLPLDKKVLETVEYSAPTIYSGLILELGFLCLNHVKEAQRKQRLPDFNYYDIDLSKTKYWPEECVKTISKEQQISKLKANAECYEPETGRLIKTINKSQETIQNISNANIPEETKQKIILEHQKNIEESEIRLEQIKTELANIQKQSENATGYTNSNDFFKHLRNGISHGFYKIDYSEALEKKDMSLIKYHFQDWEINKDNRKDRKLVFEAEITAGQLLNIYQSIKERLDDSYAFEIEEDIFIGDIRGEKTPDDGLYEELQKYIEERGKHRSRK